MTFLYVAPRYHTNQVPIMEYLVNQGHNVHFLAYRKERTENYNVVVPQLCKPSIYYRIREYLFFRKETGSIERELFRMRKFIPSFFWTLIYIRRVKPDVIIIRNRNFAASVVYLASKICRISHVLLYTQDACYTKQVKRNTVLKRFIKSIIFPQKVYSPVEMSEVSADKLYATNCHFIPFAMHFDDRVMQNREYNRGGYINILDVGKYRDYKNHFVLVKAVTLLPENVQKQLRITILGQAYSKEEKQYKYRLEQLISDNNLSTIVDVKDAVPYSEMMNQYLSHDIFILTSKVEVASVSILEAMSCGLLCISTNRNGTASYINKDFGYIFESDNEESLKDILTSIVENRTKISRMGKQTFKYAKRNYSTDLYYKRLTLLIDE